MNSICWPSPPKSSHATGPESAKGALGLADRCLEEPDHAAHRRGCAVEQDDPHVLAALSERRVISHRRLRSAPTPTLFRG